MRFAASGIANTCFGLAIIYLAMAAGVQYVFANMVGYAAGLGLSFALNRFWTFERRSGSAHKDIAPFLILALAAYGANLVTVIALIELIKINPAIAQLAGVATYAVINFAGMKYFVFPSDGGSDP
nr:GtrA family protein [Hyphomonas sediminis]